MLDLVLISTLGFLGSFGHCAGMCGPLTVAFSLSNAGKDKLAVFRFHLLLNVGRIVAYALVGGAIGGLGSVLIAGGLWAGTGSEFRRDRTSDGHDADLVRSSANSTGFVARIATAAPNFARSSRTSNEQAFGTKKLVGAGWFGFAFGV